MKALRNLARRSVSVPLMFLAALLAWGLAPAVLGVTLVSDALRRPRLFAHTRAVLFFLLYLLLEVAGILAATALWGLTLGGRLGGAGRFLALNAGLQRWWSGALFGGAVRIFAMRLDLRGMPAQIAGPVILLVRHASTADTVLAAALVANPHRILLRYVMKTELLWDPCLDIVGQRLPNSFIDRQSRDKRAQVAAVQGLAHGLDARAGVLIFPEGTRYSRRGYESAMQRLARQGNGALTSLAAGYRHVLPPRTAGTLALIEAAPQCPVLVLTHTGFEGARSFREFWGGALVGKTISATLWSIPPAQIPAAGREAWLYALWARVDGWIESVQPSGTGAQA